MGKLLSILICTLCYLNPAIADDRGFDPSGVWKSRIGALGLMRAGNTLFFSYSAVFGATAHMCDGLGVARFENNGKWVYSDDQGKLAITTKDDRVAMRVTDGVASFCAANWPGDDFIKDKSHPSLRCEVIVPKTHFHDVGAMPPERRRGYVIEGDPVEAVDLVSESSQKWLLARFVGKQQTTAGLLASDAMECRYESTAANAGTPASSPEQALIPGQFHGHWDTKRAVCGKLHGANMNITAGEIRFYESAGIVAGIVTQSKNEITVSLKMSGEGEVWEDKKRLLLSDDGKHLVHYFSDGDSNKLIRCPE